MPSSPCSSWDETCLRLQGEARLQVAVSQGGAVLKWGWKESGALGTSSSIFRSSLALFSTLLPGGGGGCWFTPQACLFAFLLVSLALPEEEAWG